MIYVRPAQNFSPSKIPNNRHNIDKRPTYTIIEERYWPMADGRAREGGEGGAGWRRGDERSTKAFGWWSATGKKGIRNEEVNSELEKMRKAQVLL